MEYKVLTKEDRRWSGKFSPENLEHTLNSYAADGWRVVSSVPVASMWTISTSQIMILLERETPGELTHLILTPARQTARSAWAVWVTAIRSV